MAIAEEPEVEMLTLSELAHLYRHPDDFLSAELGEKLISHVLADPRYAGLIEQAEAMARDAGVESPGFALFYHEDLEKLLNAEGWDDPAEVLQPDDEDTSCLGHRRMIRILDARMARGEDPETLMPVKERLERYEVKYAELALQELVQELARLSPGTAARIRQRTLAALQATQQPAALPQDEGE